MLWNVFGGKNGKSLGTRRRSDSYTNQCHVQWYGRRIKLVNHAVRPYSTYGVVREKQTVSAVASRFGHGGLRARASSHSRFLPSLKP